MSQWYARTLFAALFSSVAGAALAVPVLYNRTITITNAQRPINIASQGGLGINPFAFEFDDAPAPFDLTTLLSITVFGEADLDGLPDAGGSPPPNDTLEIASFTLDGITIAGLGSSFGLFGARPFSVSATAGIGGLNFADGLSGAISLGIGVDGNLSTDFLSVRISYLYDGVDITPPPSVVPRPAGAPLLLAGLGALAFARRRRRGL